MNYEKLFTTLEQSQRLAELGMADSNYPKWVPMEGVAVLVPPNGNDILAISESAFTAGSQPAYPLDVILEKIGEKYMPVIRQGEWQYRDIQGRPWGYSSLIDAAGAVLIERLQAKQIWL